MYDFFYNKLLKNCPSKIDLGMSDTDSLLLLVDKPDLFWKHVDPYMDYSNYEKTHPKYSETNKSQLGYFKDELCGSSTCLEFVGLRPKCYCLKLENKKTGEISTKKTSKGIGRVAIKNRMTFKQYKKCLFKGKVVRHEFNTIRSNKHKITTIRQRKLALSNFCAKRYLFCSIHSAPYYSKLITNKNQTCPFCAKK